MELDELLSAEEREFTG